MGFKSPSPFSYFSFLRLARPLLKHKASGLFPLSLP
uniref:Uncharacterized protein n=1 Tax=Anguilla anguilla TaxID=7936 RepID=A0A0E9W4K6_ANGAN